MFRSHRQTYRQKKTLIRVAKYFHMQVFKTFSLFGLQELACFFVFFLFFFFFYVHHWHYGEKHCGVCPYQCTAYWIQLLVNLMAKKTVGSHSRGAKLAHVTVPQLSQGQLRRWSHSSPCQGYSVTSPVVTGSHTASWQRPYLFLWFISACLGGKVRAPDGMI